MVIPTKRSFSRSTHQPCIHLVATLVNLSCRCSKQVGLISKVMSMIYCSPISETISIQKSISIQKTTMIEKTILNQSNLDSKYLLDTEQNASVTYSQTSSLSLHAAAIPPFTAHLAALPSLECRAEPRGHPDYPRTGCFFDVQARCVPPLSPPPCIYLQARRELRAGGRGWG